MWWPAPADIKQGTLKSEERSAIYMKKKWTAGEKSIKVICGQLCFDY